MRLLVSVRSVDEALAVAACDGVDLIDLKEPRRGALGALPLPALRAIVAALRGAGCTRSLSATVGDVADDALLDRVAATAACGVDLVKVGIDALHGGAKPRLEALAACGHAVVPVFLADRGWDFAGVDAAARLGFPALMADTDDKRAGSLLEVCREADLARFVARVRAAGRPVGLAGSLHARDLPALRRLVPDFAGFRSAVCGGDRAGSLDPVRLRALVAQAREEAVPAV